MNYSFAKSELVGNEQLIIYGSPQCRFVPYILETIACNSQLNILQPTYKETDGKVSYLYNTNCLISLKDFLQNHEVGVDVVCRILKSIATTIVNSNDYLLSSDKFVLLSELMFIDDSVDKVKLVVVPGNESVFEDTEQAIKEVVVDIVFNLTIYSDDGGGFIENLLNLMKKEFSLDKLLALCNAYEQTKEEAVGEEEQVADEKRVAEIAPVPEAVRELFEEEQQKPDKAKEKNKNLTFYMVLGLVVIVALLIRVSSRML